ncbi:hypothetical protein ACJROX_10210 [Pseudalkalibacillus sp. A8]|uniref:hypothetical protein n=1 Tax=Pseudalkalibacillus sp. A8 TaxID=3382641 RepID=UPI0038B4F944
MEKRKANWVCKTCGKKDKNAHYKAMADYGLLVKPTFHNAQIKDFLQIPSSNSTTYLLRKAEVPKEGRTYNLPVEFLYKHSLKRI